MLQPRKMSERYSAPRQRVCARYLTMDADVHARVRNGTWKGDNLEVSRNVACFFYLLTFSPPAGTMIQGRCPKYNLIYSCSLYINIESTDVHFPPRLVLDITPVTMGLRAGYEWKILREPREE